MTAVPRIRTVALCVFRDGDRILVLEGRDPAGERDFHRPLGGGVEFGESSAEAVVREIREEVGAEIADVRLLGVLENRFTYDGAPKHEVVFVFDARFVDAAHYEAPRITGNDNGVAFSAVWREIEAHAPALYPDGLRELLRG